METMPLDGKTAHHGGDVCVMCVSIAKQSPERERNTLTAYSYWRSRAPTFRQASLVIGNFNDYCPLLAFDS
jgi:hypothetical protein